MSKNRSVPRTVCCAIPYDKRDLKVLVITSRKHPDKWVCACPPSLLHFILFINFFTLLAAQISWDSTEGRIRVE